MARCHLYFEHYILNDFGSGHKIGMTIQRFQAKKPSDNLAVVLCLTKSLFPPLLGDFPAVCVALL